MNVLSQSPVDPGFVQNPYAFYARARGVGALHYWQDYDMVCAFSHAAVAQCLKDRRFGREAPPDCAGAVPEHLRDFYAVEAHSMLELEPPRHTRLRRLVVSAFTSGRINALAPAIADLSNQLVDAFPDGPFDLIAGFADTIPIAIICRLLGVPEAMGPQFLQWSHAMVGMYQARRTIADEHAANRAARDFADYLRGYIDTRRRAPGDDLITHLIAAEEDGERLSTDELIATCILLLNAGHEATVHAIGNGVKALLDHGFGADVLGPDHVVGTVEEILRYDPPLHMFTRWIYEDVEVMGRPFARGDRIGLMLASANRDAGMWDDPENFDPTRPVRTNASFGAGLHFCVGAPLARLEMQIALPILFDRCPGLRIAEPPRYANLYHFRGLERLMVTR